MRDIYTYTYWIGIWISFLLLWLKEIKIINILTPSKSKLTVLLIINCTITQFSQWVTVVRKHVKIESIYLCLERTKGECDKNMVKWKSLLCFLFCFLNRSSKIYFYEIIQSSNVLVCSRKMYFARVSQPRQTPFFLTAVLSLETCKLAPGRIYLYCFLIDHPNCISPVLIHSAMYMLHLFQETT